MHQQTNKHSEHNYLNHVQGVFREPLPDSIGDHVERQRLTCAGAMFNQTIVSMRSFTFNEQCVCAVVVRILAQQYYKTLKEGRR